MLLDLPHVMACNEDQSHVIACNDSWFAGNSESSSESNTIGSNSEGSNDISEMENAANKQGGAYHTFTADLHGTSCDCGGIMSPNHPGRMGPTPGCNGAICQRIRAWGQEGASNSAPSPNIPASKPSPEPAPQSHPMQVEQPEYSPDSAEGADKIVEEFISSDEYYESTDPKQVPLKKLMTFAARLCGMGDDEQLNKDFVKEYCDELVAAYARALQGRTAGRKPQACLPADDADTLSAAPSLSSGDQSEQAASLQPERAPVVPDGAADRFSDKLEYIKVDRTRQPTLTTTLQGQFQMDITKHRTVTTQTAWPAMIVTLR